jgi:hypothetical protein
MVFCSCNFSTQEAETGGLKVLGQPELVSETLSKKLFCFGKTGV